MSSSGTTGKEGRKTGPVRGEETELRADRSARAPSTLRTGEGLTVRVEWNKQLPGRRWLWASWGAPPGTLGAHLVLGDGVNHLEGTPCPEG